jgi:hypothetical protein
MTEDDRACENEACGKPVHLLHDPMCGHGHTACPECGHEAVCDQCAAGDLLPPARTLADIRAEQEAHLARRKAESGYDPVTLRRDYPKGEA